tara:strand:- start:9292 stop:10731 length:1440 start_codon:yes stop_codon:yes gene_type:complete
MSLGKKMFTGVIWSAIDKLSTQAIQFILNIVLARLLTPEEYGTVGLLLVFIAISRVFIDSGFTKALIQKQDRDQTDISTVFLFNIIISIVVYTLLWIAAPFIADFYNIEILSILLRVLAISLILNALYTVPYTLISITLDFKTISKINLASTIFSGLIAVYLAYNGYGVWALVFQTIINSITTVIMVWIFNSWRPSLVFSKNSFKSLFSYGSNLLVSSLLERVVSDLSSLLIGKYLSAKNLGYYTRGTQFTNFFFSSIGTILDRVLLPGLATVQNDMKELVRYAKQIIRINALITIPLFLGLGILADPIIRVLLTERWIMAVPIMQVLCVARLITLLCSINVNILYIIGRTDLALRQQYLKIVIRVILVVASIKFGIIYIALAELLSTSIHYFINSYYPGKLMQYGAIKQIKDIFPFFIAGFVMALIVFLTTFFLDDSVLKLIVGPAVGIPSYLIMIKLLKIKELKYLIQKLKEFKIKS